MRPWHVAWVVWAPPAALVILIMVGSNENCCGFAAGAPHLDSQCGSTARSGSAATHDQRSPIPQQICSDKDTCERSRITFASCNTSTSPNSSVPVDLLVLMNPTMSKCCWTQTGDLIAVAACPYVNPIWDLKRFPKSDFGKAQILKSDLGDFANRILVRVQKSQVGLGKTPSPIWNRTKSDLGSLKPDL